MSLTLQDKAIYRTELTKLLYLSPAFDFLYTFGSDDPPDVYDRPQDAKRDEADYYDDIFNPGKPRRRHWPAIATMNVRTYDCVCFRRS